MNTIKSKLTWCLLTLWVGFGLAMAAERPIRLAIYVDRGASGIGVYQHLEYATFAEGVESFPVDGEMIRAGVLDRADVLLMPGGSSVAESNRLGEAGRERLKAFIRGGGGYIGTCAGCVLLTQSTKSHPNMLGVLPYRTTSSRGRGDVSVLFNDEAKRLVGIRPGAEMIRYSLGPVLVPAGSDTNFTAIATYNGDLELSPRYRETMVGKTAAIAGTYGKGRIFVTAVHPEFSSATVHYLRDGFRYVTHGRTTKWTLPLRRRGQLCVGVLCDGSLGVGNACRIQRLLREHTYDLFAVSSEGISKGELRRLDALIVPDWVSGREPGCLGENTERFREFLGRGGRLFGWGRTAGKCHAADPRTEVYPDAKRALAALAAFAAEPAPVPGRTKFKKVAKPLRAAIYTDKAGSNCVIARFLMQSPEFEVDLLSAENVRRGKLSGYDLYIQPGGGCHRQMMELGPAGVLAITNYVHGGGKFYGICAGAFMASQQISAERPRLGLVPWRHDDCKTYRGTAHLPVNVTEAGRKVFGPAKRRRVQYYGGPVLLPGKPVPDTEIDVLATYANANLSNFSPKPATPMLGHAAFVGGRVGKGKVVVSCPHPEFNEYSFDFVPSIISYLTGVRPTQVNLDRRRGALAVACRFPLEDAAANRYVACELMGDRRFHCAGGAATGNGLRHLDAVVLLHPEKKDVTGLLGDFARRGGRVIALCTTDEERRRVEKIPHVCIVRTYAEVIPVLASSDCKAPCP